MMAIYVKFIEFQNTISFFNSVKKSNMDLLNDVKNFIPSEIWDNYEGMMNMMNMMNMVNMFQDMDMDFDPMSMMANMFTNEEKEGDTDDGLDQ